MLYPLSYIWDAVTGFEPASFRPMPDALPLSYSACPVIRSSFRNLGRLDTRKAHYGAERAGWAYRTQAKET